MFTFIYGWFSYLWYFSLDYDSLHKNRPGPEDTILVVQDGHRRAFLSSEAPFDSGHSSEIRGLFLMKWPKETLRNFL